MLFYIDKTNKTQLETIKQTTLLGVGWSELDLETLLTTHLPRVIPENQLMVFFRERRGNAEADIYALDRNGILHLFELKAVGSNPDNIMQIFRYGQAAGQYDYDRMEKLYRYYSKDQSLILKDQHQKYFDLKETMDIKDFNAKQKFILVTNGNDIDTLKAIRYWQDMKIDIEIIIYRVYAIENKTVLEFNPYNPEREPIVELSEGYYVVNTNLTYSKVNYREMLNKPKAAAYYDRKYGITNLKKGIIVYLYHVGLGVIAKGKVKGPYQKAPYDLDIDEEYYVDLDLEWKYDPDIATERDKSIKAWEINNAMGASYRFRQTVFAIPEDMAKVIDEIQAKRV